VTSLSLSAIVETIFIQTNLTLVDTSGLLKGPDKGSFYNERFIRGLPFLAKKMKRLGGAKIVEDINISHEPILWKISAEFPTPVELSKDSLDYTVLDSINKCIKDGGDWPSWPKAKVPFVHSTETGIDAKTDANEAAVDAAVAQTNLLTPQGGMMNRSVGATGSGSASLSGHDRLPSIQESLNITNMDASLQQHLRLLHGQQGYNGQLEQRNPMQQPLRLDQNQQVNGLLLNLMLNERNQAMTTLSPQQHHAWPQHQLQTAPPAANTAYPNMLRNTARFVNEYNPTAYAPVAEPLSLQRILGNANLSTRLSGLQQAGNHVSVPQGSADLRSLHLLQANQAQGRQQSALDPTTVLSIVMRNILQTQLHQATMRPNMFELYPNLSQSTDGPFGQPSHSADGILADLTSQSQRLRYSQQPQAYQLEQNSLPQQHQMAQSLPQQHQQMQQHDRQDQHPDQPQDKKNESE
jgi:hypothetical protein